MAESRKPLPALLVVAAFSRHTDALRYGRDELERAYGVAGLVSEPFEFRETEYYRPTMGEGLLKQFLAFQQLVDPADLATIKLRTNGIESALVAGGCFGEVRPLNLDPGLLTLGKFMLATTKDQGHRIYLRDGIFAEVTLRYQAGAFQPWPWTYADYRRPDVHEFLLAARNFYRDRLREHVGSE
jgi:hypothetical protein